MSTTTYSTAFQSEHAEEADEVLPSSSRRELQQDLRSKRRTMSPRVAVALIAVAGLGIRLIIVRGFWLDEATEADYGKHSFGTMLTEISHDNHPPLHYILIWLIEHFVGTGEFGLRVPSIVFGTLTIPMMYLAGRALYNQSAGVLAALFTAVSPLGVWYSQEARMYALFMLLAAVTIWAQAQILKTGRKGYWVAWASASAAMIWSQWFAMLCVATEVAVFLWAIYGRRRDGIPVRALFKRFLLAVACVIVVVLPGIPLLLTQFSNNQANGLGLSGPASITFSSVSPYGIFNNLIWALWGYHSNSVVDDAVAIWPLGILALFLILGRRRSRSNGMLLAIALVPMGLIFVGSVMQAQGRSLFEVRYFIEAIPALLLLIAGACTTMTPSHLARRVAVSGIVAVMALGLVLQQTDSGNSRLYGYEWAFSQINAAAKPGDRILYDPSFLNVDVNYFSPEITAFPLSKGEKGLSTSSKLFLVGSFPFSESQSEQAAANRAVINFEQHRQLLRILRAPNVVVWEFS
jgi:uncharacterized membrane protein